MMQPRGGDFAVFPLLLTNQRFVRFNEPSRARQLASRFPEVYRQLALGFREVMLHAGDDFTKCAGLREERTPRNGHALEISQSP